MATTNDSRSIPEKYKVEMPAVHGMLAFVPQTALPQTRDLATSKLPFESSILQSMEERVEPGKEQIGSGAGPVEERAIWIVHGMGQQIPFQTLDSLTEGLLSVASRINCSNTHLVPAAQSARIGDQTVQRVVLRLKGKTGIPYELHLYEAYWAPLTEGVANLRDVIGFLLDGVWRGLLNSGKRFKIAMFDCVCQFRIPWLSPIYILATLTVLAALGVINAVILAATGAHLSLFGNSVPIAPGQWRLLTAFGSSASAIAISFGVLLFLAELCKPPTQTKRLRRILELVSWTGTILTAVAIIVCAVSYVWVLRKAGDFAAYRDHSIALLQAGSSTLILTVAVLTAGAMAARAWKRSNRDRPESFQGSRLLLTLTLVTFLVYLVCLVFPAGMFFWPRLTSHLASSAGRLAFLPGWLWLERKLTSPWWVWPFLGFVSWQARYFLVEYVGDVAIYITPNKVDRFYQVRQNIKDVAYQSARAVYLAERDSTKRPLYSRVAVIGHSLGAVIAYDALNRLISEDAFAGNSLRVVGRTCLFETFGAPLDKIAYFFTIQGKDSFQIRGQLAQAARPMVQNYAFFRKFPWVNVLSRNDVIAGPVTFYDLPSNHQADCKCLPCAAPSSTPGGSSGERARDVIDEDASVALAAHVDYWKNATVWLHLLERVAP